MDEKKEEKKVRDRLSTKKPWVSLAFSLCIAVLFYFILSNLDVIWGVVTTVAYYIYPVVAGIILAYLINPLMKLLERKPFRLIKRKGLRRAIALTLSIILVFAVITGIVIVVLPSTIDSVMAIYQNKDQYIAQISQWLSSLGAKSILTYFEDLTSGDTSLFDTIVGFISNNGSSIKEGFMSVGGHLGAWGLGIIFSIYFLAGKDRMCENAKKLLTSMIKNERRSKEVLGHIKNIDEILSTYLTFTIVDSILIGIATGIFMLIFGMEYAGLIAVLIGVTNLIPTFGPIIGTVVGAVLLLLSNPWDAVGFVIFELVYQTLDGYVIRPKLFGKTLGVSGLAILIALIVGGRILGVIGILISIPVVAIGDYLIKKVYIPMRTERAKREAEKEKAAAEAGGPGIVGKPDAVTVNAESSKDEEVAIHEQIANVAAERDETSDKKDSSDKKEK